jgi:hypothetical protein
MPGTKLRPVIRVLVVADINTRWRSRPFQALSELRPVLGLAPMDPLIATRHRRFPWGIKRESRRKMMLLSIVLPFGWATRRATEVSPRLWKTALKECRSAGAEASGLVVTSPHYASLVEQQSAHIPTFYYCSDDYSNYSGWDASTMREQESSIIRQARHSFFVSAALRDRAVEEYGANPARMSVSMNATDEEFLLPASASQIDRLIMRFPRLRRPIAGVIGGINERLDFHLIEKVAESNAVGSVLLVGPVTRALRDTGLDALRRNPKCIFTGEQAHDALRVWLQVLDVALIPFRHCHFNTMCSPMRLFDHLGAGRPIVATNACPQIIEFNSVIGITENPTGFVDMAVASCRSDCRSSADRLRPLAHQHTWRVRAEQINATVMSRI